MNDYVECGVTGERRFAKFNDTKIVGGEVFDAIMNYIPRLIAFTVCVKCIFVFSQLRSRSTHGPQPCLEEIGLVSLATGRIAEEP